MFDDIATTALDLLMDDPTISHAMGMKTAAKLGRLCKGEDDEEWYETLAGFYDELIAGIARVNLAGQDRH